jgi:hypothetical protein
MQFVCQSFAVAASGNAHTRRRTREAVAHVVTVGATQHVWQDAAALLHCHSILRSLTMVQRHHSTPASIDRASHLHVQMAARCSVVSSAPSAASRDTMLAPSPWLLLLLLLVLCTHAAGKPTKQLASKACWACWLATQAGYSCRSRGVTIHCCGALRTVRHCGASHMQCGVTLAGAPGSEVQCCVVCAICCIRPC